MRQSRHQIQTADDFNESNMIGDMPKDPNLQYVKIEKASNAAPGYRPDYGTYKRLGYTKVSDDPAVTGDDALEVWAVDKKKYEAHQKQYEDEALASAAKPSVLSRGEFETTETGAAMTLKQLEASVKGN